MTEAVKKRKPREHKQPVPSQQVIQLGLMCPSCRASQLEHVYQFTDKPWFKCHACGEVTPSAAWRVIFLGAPPLQY